MSNKLKIACSFILFFNLSFAQNINWKLRESESFISYQAKHLLHPWKGVNKNVRGIVSKVDNEKKINELAILILVKDFDSNNTGRDAHALEALEVLSYPEVRFYSNSIELNVDSVNIHGTFDFHGVTKNQTIIAEYVEDIEKWKIKGNFTLKLTDYNMELPSFMMIKMEDFLNFEFELIFDKY